VLTIPSLFVAEYAFVVPVCVTIDDAALGRLALAAPAPVPATASGINGTGTAASVSYDLSVADHNRKMSVWLCAPLDAELRFRGRTLARARVVVGGGGGGGGGVF
jgi:hypothetical protein